MVTAAVEPEPSIGALGETVWVGNSSPAAWKRFRLLRPLYTDR